MYRRALTSLIISSHMLWTKYQWNLARSVSMWYLSSLPSLTISDFILSDRLTFSISSSSPCSSLACFRSNRVLEQSPIPTCSRPPASGNQRYSQSLGSDPSGKNWSGQNKAGSASLEHVFRLVTPSPWTKTMFGGPVVHGQQL